MTKRIVEVWDDTVGDVVEEEYDFELCPICGAEHAYVELNHNIIDEDWWRVVCEMCDFKSEYTRGLGNAVDVWNRTK